MDDIRDTRPWFWILIFILFAVAVVGLLVAISAKNTSVDEKKVVDDATAQIKEELGGVNGALKAVGELQEEQDKLAAQDRARIKRQVAKASSGAKKKLHKLNKRVASLEGQMSEVQGQNAKLKKNVANLTKLEEALAAEVVTINRRLRNLTAEGAGNGGT